MTANDGLSNEPDFGRIHLTGQYCSFHREGRMLSFFSSRRNWDSLNPHPPPPPVLGGGHTRLAGEGLGESIILWESPSFDEGTYTVVLFIYTYLAVPLNSQILSSLF
jgi:hypothetical protein